MTLADHPESADTRGARTNVVHARSAGATATPLNTVRRETDRVGAHA
jgi:hypothetical protein